MCSLVQCIGSSIGDEEQISNSRKCVEKVSLVAPKVALFGDAPEKKAKCKSFSQKEGIQS